MYELLPVSLFSPLVTPHVRQNRCVNVEKETEKITTVTQRKKKRASVKKRNEHTHNTKVDFLLLLDVTASITFYDFPLLLLLLSSFPFLM